MSDPAPDKSITTLLLRNRHLLWLSVIILLVGGISAVLTLPLLEDPRIVNRDPIIITFVPGESAERVEALVTDVLEEALDEIDTIDDMASTSRAGVSVISVRLIPDVDASNNRQIFAEIRDKMNAAAALLPEGAEKPFVDDKRDPVAFTLILAISWDFDAPPQVGLLDRLAEDLADRLRNIEGTELVRLYGEVEEEVAVEVDPAELAALNLSANAVAKRIGQADTKRPAGVLRGERADLLIEVAGELKTIERVEQIPLLAGQDESVTRVSDIAHVRRSWRKPESEVALNDGRRCVFVAARVESDTRVDAWADRAEQVLAAFEAHRAPGVRVERVFQQRPYTTSRLILLAENLLAGGFVIALAVFVIMGLRPALIVSTSLPIVVATVMFCWRIADGRIHQMSIFGMIIALGLLVDNAIVVTDEIAARKSRGIDTFAAVRGACGYLFPPLLTSTVTTILAFSPIMLLPGAAGDFVGSIGTSVILAIIASFLTAFTITAALAGLYARPAGPQAQRHWYRDGFAPPWLTSRYKRVLRKLYAAPLASIALAAAAPAAGFVVAPTLGSQFFPAIDRNMFEVRLWAPSETSIGETTALARGVEQTLRSINGVEHVSWLIGGSHPSVFYNLIMNQDRAAGYAQAIVTTTSAGATKRMLSRAQATLDALHPSAQIIVRQFTQGPPVISDVEYRIFGPDIPTLQALGDRYRIALQAHPDVLHTQTTMPRGEPKLLFRPDEDAARIAGLSLGEIAVQLDAALEGSSAVSVVEDLEQMPVRVRTPAATRRTLDEIGSSLLVKTGSDRWISAASLGDFELLPELGGLTRFDGERTNIIQAFVRNEGLPIDVNEQVKASLAAEGFRMPAGYHVEYGGATEKEIRATTNLSRHAPVLITGMIATLILAFRSLRWAAVLVGVAVGATGLSLLSTWSIGLPISFNTILATLGLIGVGLNDSVVVLAAIRADPAAAAGDRAAIERAVAGTTRHVIATTVTTMGGFLPLLLFVGGDFWPSLAIVLVGGIAGTTIIALLYMPAAYILFHPRRGEATS